MFVAQITDLHIVPKGQLAYGHVDTAAHLAAAVAHLNALRPQPDLVLVTGDLVDSGQAEEYAHLAELLGQLTAPFRLVPGNHDDRDALRAGFPKHDYLRSGGAFCHYSLDHGPIRLIGLDTLRENSHWGAFCSERVAWLDERLSERPDAPTVLFGHHPPFVTGMAVHDNDRMIGRDELAATIGRHPQVQFLLSGHLHRSMMVSFAGIVAACVSSTAHQVKLDFDADADFTIRMEPPACLLLRWQPEEGFYAHVSPIGDFGDALPIFDEAGNFIH